MSTMSSRRIRIINWLKNTFRPSPKRSQRLHLERFEERTVPAITVSGLNTTFGQVTFTGDGSVDSLILSVDPGTGHLVHNLPIDANIESQEDLDPAPGSIQSMTVGVGSNREITIKLGGGNNALAFDNSWLFTHKITYDGSMGGGTNTLTGNDNGLAWAISDLATLSGTLSAGFVADQLTFINVRNLNAGSAATDSLTGDNGTRTWTLGTPPQSIDNGSTTINFKGMETLQGGTGADTFKVLASTTHKIFGGAGADQFQFFTGGSVKSVDGEGDSDTLDYSARGGTNVVLQSSNANGFTGTGTSISSPFVGIDTLKGSTSTISTDLLIGRNVNSLWTINTTSSYFDGTNTLNFSAYENLFGGSGDDTFDASAMTALPTLIDGGAHTTSDQLVVNGGAYTSITGNYTDGNSGNFVFVAGGTINYTGLELAMLSVASVTDITLIMPIGPVSDASLEDNGTTGDGLLRLRTNSNTLVPTVFSNPSNSLAITRGNVDDDLIIAALPDLKATLTIGTPGAPLDLVTVKGAVTLNAGSNFTVNASSISLDSGSSDVATSGAGTIGLTASTISLTSGSSLTTASSGTIVLAGDSISLDGASSTSSATLVTIRQKSNGQKIDLGGADGAGTLGLSLAELNTITSGALAIGNGNSGDLTVSAAITRPSSTQIFLIAGGNIILNNSINTNGGTLSFSTAGQVQPKAAPTDATASTVSFSTGSDLGIAINGNTVNTAYDQLNVTGKADVTNTDLVLSGSYTFLASDTITIVQSTTGVVGTFNGLPNGATLPFGSQTLQINYTATAVTLVLAPTVVSVTVSPASVTEDGVTNLDFLFTRSGLTGSAVTVNYSIGGTATAGTDYPALSGTVIIPIGSSTAKVTVDPTADSIVEPDETVILTVTSGGGYTIGSPVSATGTITNDDFGTVSIAKTTDAAEPATNGVFTVTQTAMSSTNTVVSYSVTGTATNGTDYTTLTGSVTILANQLTATINVAVMDDSLVEGTETVIVTLTSVSGNPGITVGAPSAATVNITDNDTATVSVAKTTDGAEPATNGVFTVTQSLASSVATVVSYTVTGTATAGTDYTTLSGTVTILANQLTATINVAVMDDSLVEGTETVIVTLTSVSGNPGITVGAPSAATVNITDNDTATVSVAKTTDGAEPATNGQFTVTQTKASSTNTVVSYTVTGTATAGTDYTTLSGTVTILANQLTATIDVAVLDDLLVEGTETVIVTLTSVSGNPGITVGAPSAATVNITDNDTATVSVAKTTDGAEPGTNGVFTVTQTAMSSTDTVVSYLVTGTATNGTDYTTLTGSVTILANQLTATINVAVIDDSLVEGTETVIVTLTSVSGNPGITVGAPSAATVNITDNDTATVSVAKTTDGAEPATNGVFTVTQTAMSSTDTVVSYTVTGTATAGTDYTTLSGTVTILANQLTATINVAVMDDSLVEGTETVIVTLTSVSGNPGITVGAPSAATVNITDNDTATVSVAKTTDGAEPATNGVFTVTQSLASSVATVVSYTVTGTATAGTDYTTLSGTVTILANQLTATINVAVMDDSLVEGTETVIVTLTSVSGNPGITVGAPSAATVNITDNDTATVSVAKTTDGAEPATNGVFTVTQTAMSSTDTVVSYTVTGTATAGTDYTTLSGTVTILANQLTATINVAVLDDLLVEGTETVIVTLTSVSGNPGITVGAPSAATVNITDNDTATVSVAKTTDGAEPATNGQFTVTQTKASSTNTVVSYTVTGTATAGTDYTTLSGTVTILANQLTATIDVAVLDDLLVEGTETVIVTLTSVSGNPGITVGAPSAATVNITDNDTATVSVAKTTDGAEPGTNGVFTVTQTAMSSTDTVVSYLVTGTATNGTDYTTLTGSVTILANQLTATINVAVIDDSLVEGTETVIVTLTSVSGNPGITVGAPSAATVNITDNDTATVSVAKTTDGAEPATNGVFTVTQTAMSSTDTVVSYTVTGTATAGTDYTTLSGTVTILANQLTATINVAVLDDLLVEGTETVIVTLTSVSGNPGITVEAPSAATVNITDNDTAKVSVAKTTDGAEPATNGVFTVTQSLASSVDTVVSYTVTGTATPTPSATPDYTALSGTVTILANQLTATINVAVLDDLLTEGVETVIVTLNSISSGNPGITVGAPNSATVNIIDDETPPVSVTIAKTTDGAEPATNGLFTVTQSTASLSNTVISYTVTGTATNGTDYTTLSGTVTILAGNTTAPINVAVLDDLIVEGSETVIVTLTGITSGDPGIVVGGANMATVTIADNDTATVSVAKTTDGAEPATNGVFTVTQTALSSTDTVVSYTVTGTATAGTDYTALTGNVTILANQLTATINVAVLDDLIVEGTETVIVTLTSVSANPGITVGAPSAATVNIADNDTATVSVAKTTDGAEPSTNGSFTVTQSATSSVDTVVSYTVTGTATNGTDYTTLSGSVTILANQTTATINVAVLDDLIVEGTETVIVTLTSISSGNPGITVGAPNTATVNITDDDTATVSIAKTTDGAEPATNGVFTVTQTAKSSTDTVVSYTVTGTATAGSDYTTLSGSVTILANQLTATINVAVLDDLLVEGTENVIVTLTSISSSNPGITVGAPSSASLNIADNDTATVTVAKTTDGAEPATNGVFTVTQSLASSTDTVVSYTVTGTATAGTDYTTLSGTVTILANQLTATINVAVLDDLLVEGTETVIVTLTSISSSNPGITVGAPSAATVNIADNDTATVSVAKTADGAEPGTNGSFTVTQSAMSSADTVVSYTVTGTATNGTDYTTLSGSVTILANQLTATIDVTVLDDLIVEGAETVIVTLTSISSGNPGITVGAPNSATVNIADNDSATVSIAKTTDGAEPGTNGSFTVTQSAKSSVDTVVSYTVTGTATSGVDYTALSGTVTILANQTTATINVAVLDDLIVEGTETVIVSLTSLSGNPGITVGAPAAATVNIADNDAATVSVAKTTDGAEPATNGVFTVTQSLVSSTDTVVSYTVMGTATSGVDYTALSGTVTILANQTTATINVAVLDDLIVEGTETVIVTLTSISSSNPGITLGAPNSATVNIADNDTATVSVAKTADGAEPGTNGSFTVTQSLMSSKDTVVSYTVTGTATAGADYTALSGTVTILANQTTATINVAVLDDLIVEGTETVIVTLTSISSGNPGITVGAPNAATVNIADNDTATVSVAKTTDGAEPATNGVFTVTQTALSSKDTVVSYTVTGTATAGADYTTLSGSVTILANQTTATINVAVLDDLIVEGTETVIVTLTSISSGNPGITVGAPSAATVNIADNDTAIVSVAGTTDGSETGPTSVVFTVTQSLASSTDTVVNYTLGGTATGGGVDYVNPTGTVTILANQTTATVTIVVVNDTLVEATETLTLTLTSPIVSGNPGITVNTTPASRNITDNDSATITINSPSANEGTGLLTFTVSISNPVDTAITVEFDTLLSGTATSGLDYTAIANQLITFPAFSTADQTVNVTLAKDLRVEGPEMFGSELNTLNNSGRDVKLSGGGATLGATGTITDDDFAVATFSTATSSQNEDTVSSTRTVNLTLVTTGTVGTAGLDKSVVVRVAVNAGGTTATNGGVDYTFVSPTDLTFAPANGTSFSQNVAISFQEDITLEVNETVQLDLSIFTDGTSGQASVGVPGSHTITIVEDDTATNLKYDAPVSGGNRIVRNGGNIEIYQGAMLVASGVYSVSNSLTFNAFSGNDSMTIDFSGGNPIPGLGINYNGGGGVDDLFISKGTFTTMSFNYANANNGNISIASFGTINYTGVTPIDSTASTANDLVFNLPPGGSDAFLEDHGVGGDGFSRLRSNNSSFSTTSFNRPNNSLSIFRGNATDDLTISPLPDFDRTLNVGTGLAPLDQVKLSTSLNLTAASSLSIYAAGINIGGNSIAAGKLVELCSTASLTVAAVTSTSGTVTLRSTAGAILDGNGATNNVQAPALALAANTGIGTLLDHLETQVDRIEALDFNGGVFVDNNTAVLKVGGVTPGCLLPAINGVEVTNSGDILLTNAGNLQVVDGEHVSTVNGNATLQATAGATHIKTGGGGTAVQASGDVNLQAFDIILGDTGTGQRGTVTAGNNVNLTAGNDITVSADTGVNATKGTITGNASGKISLLDTGFVYGSYLKAGNDVILTATGKITNTPGVAAGNEGGIFAGDDITLQGASIATGNEIRAGDDISLTSNSGDITDTSPNISQYGYNSAVIGDVLTISSAGKVDLDTDVNSLNSLSAGTATFREVNGVIVNNITAGGNLITLGNFAGSSTFTLFPGDALENSSTVQVDLNTVLDLNGDDETIGALQGAGNVALGVNTLTTGGNNASTSYSGVISGPGGSVVKVGAGTFTLSGMNTYTGTTSILSGVVQMGANDVFADGSSMVVNGATAELAMAGFNDTVNFVSLINGKISNSSSTLTALMAYDMRNGLVTANLAGSVDLVKTTGGTVELAGANVYIGKTSIQGGILRLSGSLTGAGGDVFLDASGVTLDGGAKTGVITGRGVVVSKGSTATFVQNLATVTNGSGATGLVINSGASASVLNNGIQNNHIGVQVDGGTALLQGNDLSNNNKGTPSTAAGLVAQNGAIVDAGQTASVYYTHFTGLAGGTGPAGASSGSNIFLGYPNLGVNDWQANVPKAIRNNNTGGAYSNVGPQFGTLDLTAQNNTFDGASLFLIEKVIYHDVDDFSLGFVNYGKSNTPSTLTDMRYYAINPTLTYATGPSDFTQLTAGDPSGVFQASEIRRLRTTFDAYTFIDMKASATQIPVGGGAIPGTGGVQLYKKNGPSLTFSNTSGFVNVNFVSAFYNQNTGAYSIDFGFSNPVGQYLVEPNGSLTDGNYDLGLVASLIQGGGPGGQGLVANQNRSFYRFFGDFNGDRKVNNVDLNAFTPTLGTIPGQPNYRGYFNFDTVDVISGSDYAAFVRRYRNQLNANGTTTTIQP